jgi:hypothetical protein
VGERRRFVDGLELSDHEFHHEDAHAGSVENNQTASAPSLPGRCHVGQFPRRKIATEPGSGWPAVRGSGDSVAINLQGKRDVRL